MTPTLEDAIALADRADNLDPKRQVPADAAAARRRARYVAAGERLLGNDSGG